MGAMNRYAIGNNIYRLLKQRRMTQHELAARIHSHDDTVSRWMTGQRQPSSYALFRISKVLGVTMEELMEGVDDGR
jgi:transcriptional regulator with XRE-family HTH domain